MKDLKLKVVLAVAGLFFILAVLIIIIQAISSAIFMPAGAIPDESGTCVFQTVFDDLWVRERAYRRMVMDGEVGDDLKNLNPAKNLSAITPICTQVRITYRDKDGNNYIPKDHISGAADISTLQDEVKNGLSASPRKAPAKYEYPVYYQDECRLDTIFKAWEESSSGEDDNAIYFTDYRIKCTIKGFLKTYGKNSSGETVTVVNVKKGTEDYDGPASEEDGDSDGLHELTAEFPSDTIHQEPAITFYTRYVDSSGRTSYEDEAGIMQPYNTFSFYKAMISMAVPASENEDECVKFCYDYCKQLLDKAYENSPDYSLNILITQSADKEVHWNMPFQKELKPKDDGSKDIEAAGGSLEMKDFYWDISIKMTFNLKCGLDDFMGWDAWDNTVMHSNTAYNYIALIDGHGKHNHYRETAQIWAGWDRSTPDGQDNYGWAEMLFRMDRDSWIDMGVHFPGNMADMLTQAEINDIIEQIKENMKNDGKGDLSSERENFLRTALSKVGMFSYIYASHVTDLNNPPSGLDCSGFVSYILWKENVNGFSGYQSCAGMLGLRGSIFTEISKTAIRPGDIVIKNDTAGTESGSDNHVVIYGGKFTYKGVERVWTIECTTYGGIDGSQILDWEGTNRHEYAHVLNPFGD